MVGPALGHGEHAAHAHIPVVEFAVTAGFVGLFLLVFGWDLARHNAVPVKDPSMGPASTTTEGGRERARPSSGWPRSP